ncbi:hypothetical protein GCM10023176_13240 [Micromonospora coerulea]|uniref:Uncharacterized protein n=1 Tax=Micromonospora coerulea TaxID=47856 RepID=A0ABP8SBY7_9ACTN
MQPEGPYRFTEMMGVCQVGKVWWAVDGQDRLLTVAVLDQSVAEDSAWRRAFSGMADTLGAPGGTGRPYLAADFAAPAPWVAYPADGGPGAEHLFFALGQEIRSEQADEESAEAVLGSTAAQQSQPAPWALQGDPRLAPQVSSPPQPVSAPPQPVSAPPQPVSAPPQPVSGPPQPVSAPPQPVSAPPQPVSVPPHPAYPHSVSAPPHDPFTSPARRITPSEPRRRRTGRWVGIVALVLLVIGSAGGAFVWAGSGGTGTEQAQGAPGTSAPPPAVPTTPPQSPGIEPPRAGAWPKDWPKFTPGDSVRTFAELDGLGFTVKAPAEWQCTPAGRAEGFVKYNCGVPGGQPAIGGELIVRDCPLPCDEQQQTAMRQAEDAWGLQWVRGGQFVSYADSSRLQIDGERRYGLVVVAYWRGGSTGRVDRQLVFRMTSPIDGAGRLRRVANHLRDTLIF